MRAHAHTHALEHSNNSNTDLTVGYDIRNVVSVKKGMAANTPAVADTFDHVNPANHYTCRLPCHRHVQQRFCSVFTMCVCVGGGGVFWSEQPLMRAGVMTV